jgi:hypothetical protein
MIRRIPENVSGWLAGWILVTTMDEMLPPRKPNDDDDDQDEEDVEDEDEDEEPAVIREPDE